MFETAKTLVTPLNQSMDNTGSLNQPKNFLTKSLKTKYSNSKIGFLLRGGGVCTVGDRAGERITYGNLGNDYHFPGDNQ